MDATNFHVENDLRRQSTRNSTRSIRSRSDSRSGSSESYDMSDLGVADGFRPQPSTEASTPPQPEPARLAPPQARSSSPSPSQASTSAQGAFTSNASAQSLDARAAEGASIPRPSSVSKTYRPHDSLTLNNDGSTGGLGASLNRSQPSGGLGDATPSPNGGLSSPSSDPTNSFRSYLQRSETAPSIPAGEGSGHQGPAHPYALYLQSTEPLDATQAHQIPVGFAGMGSAYQRQIGPDGEEAGGLIGPMGHMEELPPYTRYPEPAVTTNRNVTASSPTGSSGHDATPTTEHSPTRGEENIGATVGQSSNTGLTQTGSHPSIHSGETSDGSGHEINTAARGVAEKSAMGKWQRRARRRAWGIVPYWAICLLLVCIVTLGVLLGGLLGVLVGGNNKYDGDEENYTSGARPTTDIEELPYAPDDLVALSCGLFDLPPLDVSQAPKQCFADTTQAQAWSCEMPFRYYSMDVRWIPDAPSNENYEFNLTAVNGSDSMFLWGTQPPSLDDHVTLKLVNDAFEPSRGPAWWRKLTYDKVVIIPEIRFNVPNNYKRDEEPGRAVSTGFDATRFMTGNPGPLDGEIAWFCIWPETTMEFFIYPSQNTSFPLTAPPGLTIMTTSTLPPGASATATADPNYDPTPPYPQVVKFLERRQFNDSDSTAATCRKVKVINNGQDTEPVLDDNGDPVVVDVIESLSSQNLWQDRYQSSADHEGRAATPTKGALSRRERLELTDCGCLWWSI